ncbi:MAG TPA: DUF1080 domain-containing protein [Gammaproteobacteria bacterium]|nr:DUF1080 domain-containing protein [Gammaproteobacteria bacterium]
MRILVALAIALASETCLAQNEPESEQWIALFNGRNLDGWTPKIRQYAPGENFGDTFRVVDGLLTVAYDRYERFDGRFGHLFYERPFSHYRLRLEYRFIGEQAEGGPDWAIRNSGAMLHSQPPETMPQAQDFPVSVEVQLLGGLGDGNERSTGNLCTPGTNVVYEGEFTTSHCIDSSSPTFDGDQWVTAEILVLGDERFVHRINGEVVIEYANVTTGGGAVSGHRPEMQREGEPLGEGYISLQSESHPIQFRRVELLDLKGCMDRAAPAFRPWFVAPDPAGC